MPLFLWRRYLLFVVCESCVILYFFWGGRGWGGFYRVRNGCWSFGFGSSLCLEFRWLLLPTHLGFFCFPCSPLLILSRRYSEALGSFSPLNNGAMYIQGAAIFRGAARGRSVEAPPGSSWPIVVNDWRPGGRGHRRPAPRNNVRGVPWTITMETHAPRKEKKATKSCFPEEEKKQKQKMCWMVK